MSYNYSKLRGKIVEKFGSQAKFADEMGVSTVIINRKLANKCGFSQDDIIKWSELLGIESENYNKYFFCRES